MYTILRLKLVQELEFRIYLEIPFCFVREHFTLYTVQDGRMFLGFALTLLQPGGC